LHLKFFAHATLLKTNPGFQDILNIITVAGSADANADATKNSRISTSLNWIHVVEGTSAV